MKWTELEKLDWTGWLDRVGLGKWIPNELNQTEYEKFLGEHLIKIVKRINIRIFSHYF